MAKKLFVGNLSYSITDADLQDLFEAFGEVFSAKVIQDRDTQRSKGFGFVEMNDDAEADNAISELNEKEIDGRALVVNVAKPREDRRDSRSGGGFNRGGSGAPRSGGFNRDNNRSSGGNGGGRRY